MILSGVLSRRSLGVTRLLCTSTVQPGLHAYEWSKNGFGVKQTLPAALTTFGGAFFGLAATKKSIFVGMTQSPYLLALDHTGANVRPALSSTVKETGLAISVSPSGVALASQSGITAFPWSDADGFGVPYASMSSFTGGTHFGVDISVKGGAIAFAKYSTPYMRVLSYQDGVGPGAIIATPASAPTNTTNGVKFTPSGDALFLVGADSPYVAAYKWSSTGGFGTRYANPATLPVGSGMSVDMMPNGKVVFIGTNDGANVQAYAWSATGGFGTRYANPATAVPGTCRALTASSDGAVVAVGHDSPPYLSAYNWSDTTGFGVRFASPSILPTSNSSPHKIAFI